MTLFTVRCVQPTIGVWSGWPLKSFVLLRHHFGGTPDSPVRSDFAVLTSALFTVPSSAQSIVGCSWPLLRWLTGQSGGTPDSLVIFSGVTLRKPESGQFTKCLGLGTDLMLERQMFISYWALGSCRTKGERYPCVGAPTRTSGECRLFDTSEKIGGVFLSLLYFPHLLWEFYFMYLIC
jgi:hypothetical protein